MGGAGLLEMAEAIPEQIGGSAGPSRRTRTTPTHRVLLRRLVGLLIVVVPVAWSLHRAVAGGSDLINRGGLGVLGDLLATVLQPALGPEFLGVMLRATGVTVAYAVLGAAGALVVGLFGGLVLSDAAWGATPRAPIRAVRLVLRGGLVAVRSIHELIWALLLLSVLGLDPVVAVIAIALPFGAQTAQVFGETLDGVHPGPADRAAQRGSAGDPGPRLWVVPRRRAVAGVLLLLPARMRDPVLGAAWCGRCRWSRPGAGRQPLGTGME